MDCKDSCLANEKEFNFKFDDTIGGDFIQLEGHVFRCNEVPTYVNIKISTDDENLLILYYEHSLESQLYFQQKFDILNPILRWLACIC